MLGLEDTFLDRLMLFDKIYGLSPHPKEELYAVATDTSGQVNIWFVGDNLRRRLTPFVHRRAFPISWSPDGEYLLFNVDYMGNEIFQIYLYEGGVDWFRPFVSELDSVHITSRFCWSQDGKRFVYMANRDEKSRFDMYIMDVLAYEAKKLMDGFGGYQLPYWFFDDGIVLNDIRSHEDTTLYLYTISTGDARELTPHEGDVVFAPLAPYNKGFFLLTDFKSNFTYLAYYDVVRRVMKTVWTGEFDVEVGALGKDYLLFSINREGYSNVYLMELDGRRVKRVYIPDGVVSDIISKPGEDVFYILMSTPERPFEVYRLDLTGEFRRVFGVFHGGVPPFRLVKPFIDYYESFDGTKVHVVVYRPKGGDKHPVVVYLHGGPQSQSRVEYSPFIQYLLYRGVGVVKPNFRGSTGFGKKFRDLINRDWGGGELKDIQYLIRYLEGLRWVDIDRIGVFGASFGGFLTLSCVTRLPDYWRVGAEWFGPSNLVTFAKSVPPYWKRYMRRWVGDPEDPEDRKMLEERSPINYIDNVKVPLLIIQGAKDIRVVKQESDQIVEKLREKGLEVEYVVYEDEGHGFTKEANYKDAMKRTLDFLLKHLYR